MMHRVLSANSQKYKQNGNMSSKTMLANLYCGICNRRYYPAMRTRGVHEYPFYRHAWHSEELKKCPKHSMQAQVVDGEVWARVQKAILDPDPMAEELLQYQDISSEVRVF